MMELQNIHTAAGWNMSVMRSVERRLAAKLGRMPTQEEVQEQLQADRRLADDIRRKYPCKPLPVVD